MGKNSGGFYHETHELHERRKRAGKSPIPIRVAHGTRGRHGRNKSGWLYFLTTDCTDTNGIKAADVQGFSSRYLLLGSVFEYRVRFRFLPCLQCVPWATAYLDHSEFDAGSIVRVGFGFGSLPG